MFGMHAQVTEKVLECTQEWGNRSDMHAVAVNIDYSTLLV